MITEAERLRAADHLALLGVVNRAMCGGREYEKLHKRLCRAAGMDAADL